MIAGELDGRIAPNTLFSRRRSRRRSAAPQGQYRLPDWVWGLAVGVVVVIVGGGIFLFSGVSGGGGSSCEDELPKLPGTVDVSAEGFQQEDVALAAVITYLGRADLDNAFASFYGDVHSFTHNIDPSVRAADAETAIRVCEAVIALEEVLEGGSPSAMVAATTDLREELRDAAEVLGFPRPGG